MVVRLVLLALGVLELVFPRRVVDFWMRRAAAGDEEVALRPWVYTMARVEGIAILVWVLARRGHRADDEQREEQP